MLAKFISLHQHCLFVPCTFCLKNEPVLLFIFQLSSMTYVYQFRLDQSFSCLALILWKIEIHQKIVMRSVREIRITNIHYVLYILFALNMASAKEVTPSQRTSRKTCNPLKQLHCNIRCTLGIIYYSYKCHWANIRNQITCLVYYAHSEIASVL